MIVKKAKKRKQMSQGIFTMNHCFASKILLKIAMSNVVAK